MKSLTPAAREVLKRVPYFAALQAGEFERLAAGCELLLLPRDARAFTEGEPAAGIVVIVSGRIRVVRTAADGREQVLHEDGAGTTLADIPVFDGQGCLGTAIAVEDAELVFVPRGLLLETLDRNPSAARAVIRILAARTRRFASTIEDLSLRAVVERLAAFLLREHERGDSGTVQLPGTREQLAAHLGTVREEASRALSQLKRAGLIDVRGRTVRVLDAARLRALANKP